MNYRKKLRDPQSAFTITIVVIIIASIILLYNFFDNAQKNQNMIAMVVVILTAIYYQVGFLGKKLDRKAIYSYSSLPNGTELHVYRKITGVPATVGVHHYAARADDDINLIILAHHEELSEDRTYQLVEGELVVFSEELTK